jgi:hypothetical protein
MAAARSSEVRLLMKLRSSVSSWTGSAQVRQRGVVRAVVVDRQPHAQPAQRCHDLPTARGVGHEDVFGDLEDECLGRHGEGVEQHLDLLGQGGVSAGRTRRATRRATAGGDG